MKSTPVYLMPSSEFHVLRDKYPLAPAHSIFAALFVKRLREDEPGYPQYAAVGRYTISADIFMSDIEMEWTYTIIDEENI